MPAVVAIVPLFDHAGTVVEVLEGILAQGFSPIVVDDGSTDGGDQVVARWLRERCPDGVLASLDRNRGKAAALLAGFEVAAERGATHAITLDADGQHDPRFIADFLSAAEQHGWERTLVLGNRCPIPVAYPLGRLVGRMLSGLAIRAASGVVVQDAACGMRLYSLAEVRGLRCLGGRYAWEEEAVIRSAWAGAVIEQVPIPVIYRDHATAPSHYRFRRDWSEGTLVLVSAVAQRVFDPRTRWSRAHAGWADLAWPLLPSHAEDHLYCHMLAASGMAVAAALAGACALWHAAHIVVVCLAAIATLAVARTRAPVLPAAAGWLAGALLPTAGALAVLTIAPVWCVVAVRRLRGTSG